MKALYTWLVLAGAGILPACTIHYHGVAPDGHDDHTHSTRVVRTHRTDTVYVTGTNTVVTQPGPGRYAGNGTVRQSPPPVRSDNGQPGGVRTTQGSTVSTTPGGVRTPQGNNPPPRTNGGGRTPSTGTSAGGSISGGGRTPSTGTSAGGSISGGVRTPSTGTSAGGQVASPSQSVGGVRVPASQGSAGTATTGAGGAQPQQQYPTGGIKPVRPAEPATHGSVSPSSDEYATGGIKPIRGATPNNGAGSTSGQPTQGQDHPTGGIKPVRTKEHPANGNITQDDHFQTGGIKPMRDKEPPTNGNITQDDHFQTGGIKPMRDKQADNGNVTQDDHFQTGGIKPMRDHQTAHPGEGPATSAGGHHATNQAAPALLFAKMPCRGACPTYTATIWPDGRVVYVGQQNVSRLGTHELHLDPATVASLQQQAHGVGFAELPESFASGNTDIPATMLTLYWGEGKSKTVSVEDTAPAEVQALFDHINGTLMQLAETTEPSGDVAKPRRGR